VVFVSAPVGLCVVLALPSWPRRPWRGIRRKLAEDETPSGLPARRQRYNKQRKESLQRPCMALLCTNKAFFSSASRCERAGSAMGL